MRQTIVEMLKGIERQVEPSTYQRCEFKSTRNICVFLSRTHSTSPSRRQLRLANAVRIIDDNIVRRYNPDNLSTLEKYVEIQSRENAYDLEANLAVLKLYQLDPTRFSQDITCQILLKALTNFPHTDFVLCKCLLTEKIVSMTV